MYDNNISYAPAHNQFGHNISILHFIGQNKPWKYQRFADGRILPLGGNAWEGLKDMVQEWWNTWDEHYGRVSGNLRVIQGILSELTNVCFSEL